VTSSSAAGRTDSAAPWRWPVDLARYDAAPLLRPAEQDAIIELGAGSWVPFPGCGGFASVCAAHDSRSSMRGDIRSCD
jgi:hypothetical protein